MEGGIAEVSNLKTFRDLRVWQSSYELCIALYTGTKTFPKSEQFALTNQMRRAVVSISSNIAEGYGRHQPKDKEHFYVMAAGSATELESQLEIAHGLGYFSDDEFKMLRDSCMICNRQIHALLRVHRTRN